MTFYFHKHNNYGKIKKAGITSYITHKRSDRNRRRHSAFRTSRRPYLRLHPDLVLEEEAYIIQQDGLMAKKKYRIFGITSRLLMLIVAVLLALSYLSIVINPARIWLVSLSGIFYVPLMTLNLILLLWALKRRSRSFMIPLLALIPSFFFIGRYVQFNSVKFFLCNL